MTQPAPALRCHDAEACALGLRACPSPAACGCAPTATSASIGEQEREKAAQHYGTMAREAQVAATCLHQIAEPLSEQDAGLLEQAASMLEALEGDERNHGNCSAAEGAGCSAHAVRRLAVQLLQAAPPAQAGAGITIDFKQATELLAMFGGEPTEITLMEGDGHSGNGLYASYTDIPEEGAEFLGSHDDEAMPAAPAQAVRMYSREEWIAQAAQVYMEDGDDLKTANDLARWHWNQQDWTSGELDDPREMAREDLAGRDKPTAHRAQRMAEAALFLLDVHDERGMPTEQQTYVPEAWDQAVTSLRAAVTDFPAAAPAQEHATQLAGQGQAVYELNVRGVFQDCTPTVSAFGLPDGKHQLYLSAAPAQAQEDARDAAGFTRGFNAATCVALQVLRGAGDTDSASWREILNAAGRAEVENYAKNIAPENWKLCGFAQLDAARAAQGGAA